MIQKWGGGCIVAIVVFSLLWKGASGLKVALANRSPTAMRCSELTGAPPRALWLRLSGARGMLLEASILRKKMSSDSSASEGFISELFIPLHCDGEPDEQKSRVVLATKDAGLISLLGQLIRVQNDSVALERLVSKNRDRLILKGAFTGLVRAGFEKDESVQSQLAQKSATLAAGFIVMDDGASPSVLSSLGWFIGALVGGVWFFRPRRQSVPAPAPVVPAGFRGGGRR